MSLSRGRPAARWLVAASFLLILVAWAPGARAQLAATATRDGAAAQALRLVREQVRVEVTHQLCTTTVRQAWQNELDARVEGHFTLRAGDGASVAGFAYWNGDEKIVGEVLERGAAKAVYETTVRRQRDPGLLEKAGEGRFGFRIFPIEPRETKRVEVAVDQWLARRDRIVELRVPLGLARADAEIAVVDPRGIRRVRSSTHELEVRGEGTAAVAIRARRPLTSAPRAASGPELVVTWELADRPYQPSVVVHRDDGHDAFFVGALAAPSASVELGQDLTLVVDGSPGEGGAQARLGADRMLERVRASDRLNVIVTGPKAGPVAMLDRPAWATPELRARARTGLDGVAPAAHAGDLAEALRMAMGRQERSPRTRTIVLLTGQSLSARELATVLEEDPGGARIFAVGFGPSVDRAPLARLAAERRGRFLLVESAAALSARIDRLAREIAAPVLVDLALSAEGAELDLVYPRTLPDLYLGQEVVFAGRLRGPARSKLVLRGRAQQEVKLPIAVDLSPARRPAVAKAWARARIEDLLEDIALSGPSAGRVDETIELALAWDVVTPYTAFLAIPERELASDTARTLAEARAQKLALAERHPDATSALAGQAIAAPPGSRVEEAADGGPAPLAAAPPEPASGAREEIFEAPPGGGCAACAMGRAAPAGPGVGVASLLVALLAALRRRPRSARRRAS